MPAVAGRNRDTLLRGALRLANSDHRGIAQHLVRGCSLLLDSASLHQADLWADKEQLLPVLHDGDGL